MRGIIAALACALIVAVPGVASADQTKINDPKGDVYRVAEDGTQGDVKQGAVPNTDIQRTRRPPRQGGRRSHGEVRAS